MPVARPEYSKGVVAAYPVAISSSTWHAFGVRTKLRGATCRHALRVLRACHSGSLRGSRPGRAGTQDGVQGIEARGNPVGFVEIDIVLLKADGANADKTDVPVREEDKLAR